MFPNPVVESKLSGGFAEATGLATLGMKLASDDNPDLIDARGKETLTGHFPSGTSFRAINHFRQLMLAGKFLKYDFGREENL